jgi:CheY-like chemotaxis protein
MIKSSQVLLADDEKAITDYLAPILERAGFTVPVAHDGATALRYATDQHPDLIILDVLMPGMVIQSSGLSFFDRVGYNIALGGATLSTS